MCGIAGIFNTVSESPPPERAVLGRMAAALRHRGPDDEGLALGAFWGLANRRLAIIGVTSGHQPIGNETGTVQVTFNGEIYNHRALRTELAALGHRFATQTDTEVLVHLYEQCGVRMLDRLQGMFAFAIVDTERRSLLLARDRLGQKPLYHSVTAGGVVVFASELGALCRHPQVPRDIEPSALADFLAVNCIPAPGTIYCGVRKLPPGCWIEYRAGMPAGSAAETPPTRYWQPRYNPKATIRFADACAQTRALLEQAVAKRLESEVPLGAFLSGGLDSAVVVSLMQRQSTAAVRTFTIGFADARYDERQPARLTATHAGTEHREALAEPRDFELLRRLVRHHGEPFADSSMLPTALLSGFTRQHVTVALSGDGGDELFGGYRRYQAMLLHRHIEGIPRPWRRAFCDRVLRALPAATDPRAPASTLRRTLEVIREDGLTAYSMFQGVFPAAARAALLVSPNVGRCGTERLLGSWETALTGATATDAVERLLELDTRTYLPDDLLCKVDIASMMESLEVRCPFLDHDLVEFVASLPRRWKVGLWQRKGLLRACARAWLPASLLHRGKRGFGVPVSHWLRTDWRDTTRALAEVETWDCSGLLRAEAVRLLVEEHLEGRRDHGARLWAILCLKLWQENGPSAAVG